MGYADWLGSCEFVPVGGEGVDLQTRALDVVVAALLVGLGLTIRLPGMAPSSLFLDDAWLVAAALGDPSVALAGGLTSPGFALALHALFRVVGFSHVAAQLPALIAGLAGIAVAYGFTRWLTGSIWSGLVAGLLITISPMHVAMSVRVKHYTLDALLAFGLMALAVWLLRQPLTRNRLAASCAVILGFRMVSAATACVGLVTILVLWHHATRSGVAWLAPVVGLFLGWCVWGVLYLRNALTTGLFDYWGYAYLDTASVGTWLLSLGRGLERTAEGFAPLPAVVTLALVGLGTVVMIKRGMAWLALLAVGPVGSVIGAASLGMVPLGGGRTDVILYSGLALVVAHIIPVGRPEGQMAVSGAMAAVLLVGVWPRLPDLASYPAQDVLPLAREWQSDRGPDDALVVHGGARFGMAIYAPDDFETIAEVSISGVDVEPTSDRIAILPHLRHVPEQYAAVVRERVATCDVVWLLFSHFGLDDLEHAGRGLEEEGFTLQRESWGKRAVLQRWERSRPFVASPVDTGMTLCPDG